MPASALRAPFGDAQNRHLEPHRDLPRIPGDAAEGRIHLDHGAIRIGHHDALASGFKGKLADLCSFERRTQFGDVAGDLHSPVGIRRTRVKQRSRLGDQPAQPAVGKAHPEREVVDTGAAPGSDETGHPRGIEGLACGIDDDMGLVRPGPPNCSR